MPRHESKECSKEKTLVITMTNDSNKNMINVYDLMSNKLLQSLETKGKGGVSGNQHGIKQYQNRLLAVVNNGSSTVSIFRLRHNKLKLKKVLKTLSPPVSVDFGLNHLYVAGVNTVESFDLDSFKRDSKANLFLSGDVTPVAGATSQVGFDGNRLLITFKNDPNPGTIDIACLDKDGKIGAVTAVLAPTGSLTPFGFSVLDDQTALITLAHSNQLGLFRDDAFIDVITLDQNAPCWTTLFGKYIFTSNTASQTISRLVTTGSNIFVDDSKAATIAGGNPTDSDVNGNNFVVLDHNVSTSELNIFSLNAYGEMTLLSVIDVRALNANGVAIMN